MLRFIFFVFLTINFINCYKIFYGRRHSFRHHNHRVSRYRYNNPPPEFNPLLHHLQYKENLPFAQQCNFDFDCPSYHRCVCEQSYPYNKVCKKCPQYDKETELSGTTKPTTEDNTTESTTPTTTETTTVTPTETTTTEKSTTTEETTTEEETTTTVLTTTTTDITTQTHLTVTTTKVATTTDVLEETTSSTESNGDFATTDVTEVEPEADTNEVTTPNVFRFNLF